MRSSRPRLPLLLIAALAVSACGGDPPSEPAAEIAAPIETDSPVDGTAEVVGQAPRASQGTPSVVVLRPLNNLEIPVPAEAVVMDQYGRDFVPRLIVVREGQPVLFKNSEDELHTVHVQNEEGESLFNVGMPIRGGEHTHTFDQAGDYDVSCNAHQEMHATIFVFGNAYAVVADRDGSFSLSGVLPGTYDLELRQGDFRHEEPVEITSGSNNLRVEFPPVG